MSFQSSKLLQLIRLTTVGVVQKQNFSKLPLYLHEQGLTSISTCKMCSLPSTVRTSSFHTTITSRAGVDIDKEVSESLSNIRNHDFTQTKVSDPEDLKHFRASKKTTKELTQKDGDILNAMSTPGEQLPMGMSAMPHPIWSKEETGSVEITHKTPEGIIDHLAYYTVQTLRKTFDIFSGFNRTTVRGEKMWLKRIIFLETVAGVPGMVAAMVRHLHSLRRLRRDHGWIHTLLEEAENERMHLMTALQIKKPGPLFRSLVVLSQGTMVTYFSLAYLISPRYCHRFVGYLEEEAVKTYTKCLEDIEYGHLHTWKKTPAPEVAVLYWNLGEKATMKDVILAIRADEAHHRVVNHTLASMKQDDYNPYKSSKH